MKLKLDFVTNSSSTAFILADFGKKYKTIEHIFRDILHRTFKEIIKNDSLYKECVLDIEDLRFFGNLEEFQIYNNEGKKLDWVQKATGLTDPLLDTLYEPGIKAIKNEDCHLILFVTDNWVPVEDMIGDIDDVEILAVESW